MKLTMRRIASVGLAIALLSLGLVSGIILDRRILTAPAGGSQQAGLDVGLLTAAWNTIQQNYVDQSAVQSQALTYGAISGMANALGDTGHSRFLTAEMIKAENDFTQGQFEGIGAEVEMKGGNVVIVAPIDGSPAQSAGLRPGDVILQVDGKSVAGLPLTQVISQILGPAGTTVTLTILSPGTGETRDLSLVRARIALHNVTWQRLPGTTIAHVRLAAFSQGVTHDLQQALQDIQKGGATSVILDLRNDPGGLLDEAIGTTSQFLDSGNVLQEKNARGVLTKVAVKSGGVAVKLPMVVLINNGTASASEIVAGALQDAQRAQLVGDTTFGTGTVLNQFNLPDGSALLLATEEWLTPSGRVIWHKGIGPDVPVVLPSGATPLTPEAERLMTEAQLRASADAQLLKAIDLLQATP